MINFKKTPIIVITFALFLSLAPAVHAESRTLNNAADREAKMAEREVIKATKMQEMEEKKAELMLEREQKMLERKEELEAKKLIMMEEREAKKEERTAFRCEMIQEKISLQTDKMDRNTTRVDEIKAKWESNLEKLKSKGHDLPEIVQLETDLQTLYTMLDEYKALQTQLNADIASTKLTACNTEKTPEEAKELAQTLKDQLHSRRDTVELKKTEIKNFYNEVIKEDILAIRMAIKNSMEEEEKEDSEVVVTE